MTPAINLEKLTKIYQSSKNPTLQKTALSNISLAIPTGSIFGLLGPNGAGKSTLINILAGTVIKTSGKACIMGIDIDDNPKLARTKIGIVPQEVVLDSFFPVAQALEFTAGYYGIAPQHRKTEEILKALGLWDKKDATSRQLSGGMKRRFMVAKAMVHSPLVLILDEPTAGVDIELRKQLWEHVKKLNRQGTTIILTTHYLAEAEELCDQIAFINHGQIIKQDSKENLLKTLGSKQVYIEFDQEVSKDIFKSYPLPIEITAANKIKLKIQPGGNELNSILVFIQAAGLNVKDIQVTQTDLEDIFEQVIK